MKYAEQTGNTIQEDFEDFHKRNPRVYDMFKKYARMLFGEQSKWVKPEEIKMSSKLILNRIRWEVATKNIKDDSTGDQYKINDAFTSRYARLFQEDFPDYAYLFETRKLRS